MRLCSAACRNCSSSISSISALRRFLTATANALGHEGFVGVPSFAAGALAVGVISGAYQAEVFRAAYLAISRGELEAAVSVGMNRALLFRRIIAPQVLALRVARTWQSLAGRAQGFVADLGHRLDRAHADQPGRRRLDPSAFRLLSRRRRALSRDDARDDPLLRRRRGARHPRHAPGDGLRRPMDFDFISKTFVRLLAALPLTLSVWFLSVVLGALIAAGVTWMRVSGVKPFELFARAYVMVFRGTPLLIQLFVVYYGLASLPAVRASFAWGFLRNAFNCAVLALALCTAAYQAEIFRGALLAVPHGQVEAARACGMSRLLMFRRIFFPIALRHALPAYSTEMISMVKSTALVSLVTLWDVMSIALKIRNDTLVTYLPLILAGAIYFVVNYIIGAGFLALERRLSPHLRPRPS